MTLLGSIVRWPTYCGNPVTVDLNKVSSHYRDAAIDFCQSSPQTKFLYSLIVVLIKLPWWKMLCHLCLYNKKMCQIALCNSLLWVNKIKKYHLHIVDRSREWVGTGAAGDQTRWFLWHHLLHPLFWDTELSGMHLHLQIQISNAFHEVYYYG